MEDWLIALIVVLIILFVVLPSIIFTVTGTMTLRMMKKGTRLNKKSKIIDVSFYEKGPMKKLAKEGVEYLNSLEKEDIYIESFDGLKLHACYYKNPNGETNKYLLGMHGFKTYNLSQFGLYAKKYFELGFNLIIPDQRAHGLSDGKYLTMGIKEKQDILSWANYLVKEKGEAINILIHGISMGGASVCLASELNLPKQVIGIISDCAYSSFREELKYSMNKQLNGLPSFPFEMVISLYLKAAVGISLNDKQPVEAVKNSKVPILFFHGEKDQMVPVKFARDLYDSCSSKKELVISKDANHAESVAYLKEEYFNKVKTFFNL